MAPVAGLFVLAQGPLALVVSATPPRHSLGTLAGAVGDRPLTSVLGTLGWLVVLMVLRMLFTGRLITGREADERDERYAEKVKECAELRAAVATFAETAETSNAVLTALMQAADEQDRATAARSVSRPPT